MITPEERANRAVETAFWEYVDDNLDVMRRHEIYEDFENAIAGEIRAAIAEARPRWIPVSERLPEEDKEILIYVADEETYYLGKYDAGSWYADGVYKHLSGITHWQPLPPPPEAH